MARDPNMKAVYLNADRHKQVVERAERDGRNITQIVDSLLEYALKHAPAATAV